MVFSSKSDEVRKGRITDREKLAPFKTHINGNFPKSMGKARYARFFEQTPFSDHQQESPVYFAFNQGVSSVEIGVVTENGVRAIHTLGFVRRDSMHFFAWDPERLLQADDVTSEWHLTRSDADWDQFPCRLFLVDSCGSALMNVSLSKRGFR